MYWGRSDHQQGLERRGGCRRPWCAFRGGVIHDRSLEGVGTDTFTAVAGSISFRKQDRGGVGPGPAPHRKSVKSVFYL